MSDVVALVLPFFGMILAGAIAARAKRLPMEGLAWMNFFVVYIALPALLFQLLSRTPVEELGEVRFIAAAVFSTFMIFAVMFVGSLLLARGSIAESCMRGLGSAYGNIGYMGPGLALLVLGERAAVPVALIVCFENVLHFAVAPLLMALDGGEGRPWPHLLREVASRVLLHPFIVATMLGVGVAVLRIDMPGALDTLIAYFAAAAAPAALFVMGVTLALRPLRRLPAELVPVVALKLVVHPLLVYVVLSLAGDFDPIWVYAAMLLAALPTAANVFVIGQQYDVWVERASATVLISTVLSVVTLTALLYGIRSGMLPPDLFP